MTNYLKFTLALVFAFSLSTPWANAQSSIHISRVDQHNHDHHDHNHDTPHRTCHAHIKLQEQMQQDPVLRQRMQDMEQKTREYVRAHQDEDLSRSTRIIPVYVHVIYNSSQENISDAQINSQIQQLNADYAATNSDYNPPSDFASVASGNTGIQFELVQVTRKQSSKTSWGTNDAMKKSTQGGVDPVTPSTHLNMWVCNIGGGILGYAQFPGGSSSTDGVVMSPQYFGSNNYGSGYYLSAPFDRGRTTTHEVGHYLNLRHIWGDGGCSVDDYVDDTPVAGSANYGCPSSTQNSCSGGSRDMHMNYMDYSDDQCMYMFSAGQAARMQACLNSTRANLGYTGGGSTPTCNDGIQNGDETGVDCGGSCSPCDDGGTPPSSSCYAAVTFSLTTDNYGSETTWTLKDASGSTVESGSGYGNNATTNLSWTLADGNYTFTINDSYGDGICCSYGNGSYTLSGDGQAFANGGSFGSSESVSFCVEGSNDGGNGGNPGGGTGSAVLHEGFFESGWDGWTDGGSDCFRYSGQYSYEGSYSIRLRDNSGAASAMTSETFDLSGYSETTFELVFYPNSMESGEDFLIEFSTNGSTWTTLGSYAAGSSFENGSFYAASVSTTSNSSTAQFRVRCDASANADQVYIDQVKITGSNGTARNAGATITKLDTEVAADNTAEAGYDALEDATISAKLYPNPANNVLNIELTAQDASCETRIMDVTGKTIWQGRLDAGSNSININSLPSGLYYLNVIQENGAMTTEKFLKN